MANPYANAEYDRRYGGTFLIDGRDVGVSRRCCHCGCHWLAAKGSGAVRGWCVRCNGHTCGPTCVTRRFGPCIPHDVYLLILEGSVTPGNIPIIGRVEGDVPAG